MESMVISQNTVLQTHAMQTEASEEVVAIAVRVEQTDETLETVMAVETDLINLEEKEIGDDEIVTMAETIRGATDLETAMTDVSRTEGGTEIEMSVLSTVGDTLNLKQGMLTAVLQEAQIHLHCENAKLWTSKEIENVS